MAIDVPVLMLLKTNYKCMKNDHVIVRIALSFLLVHLEEVESNPAPENFCMPDDTGETDSPLFNIVWQYRE